jgi:serine-type D-Ala-D-Ala carboxypeptidase/endopeptidase (penicillin-binding protein 4)
VIAAHALPPAPAAVVSAAQPKTDRTLKADLVRLAKRAGGSGGFTVLDGGSGRVLAESAGSTARPLGSTAKLLTTGVAALAHAERPLQTAVMTAAPLDPATGTLGGDLILEGGGDPLLGEAQLQRLADAVQAGGIRTITGSVVGDGRLFDALAGGPATGGAFDLNFNGSVGALTYDRGRQAVGGPLQPDPARAAAYRFDDVLEARGITIRGVPKAGVAPAGAAALGLPLLTGLAPVIKDINKVSDDFAAEVLAKDLAVRFHQPQPATTAEGAAVIRAQARRLGATLFPVDGSGVDPATKGSPRQLARFVRRIRAKRLITASLPIAGVDGTLATRMTSGAAHRNCHAKTGSLPQSRDSSLAGWCTVHGRTLVFSIQRVHVSSQPAAKAAEDAMVQRIAASRRR